MLLCNLLFSPEASASRALSFDQSRGCALDAQFLRLLLPVLSCE